MYINPSKHFAWIWHYKVSVADRDVQHLDHCTRAGYARQSRCAVLILTLPLAYSKREIPHRRIKQTSNRYFIILPCCAITSSYILHNLCRSELPLYWYFCRLCTLKTFPRHLLFPAFFVRGYNSWNALNPPHTLPSSFSLLPYAFISNSTIFFSCILQAQTLYQSKGFWKKKRRVPFCNSCPTIRGHCRTARQCQTLQNI